MCLQFLTKKPKLQIKIKPIENKKAGTIINSVLSLALIYKKPPMAIQIPAKIPFKKIDT